MGYGALSIVTICYALAALDAAKKRNIPLAALFVCWAVGALVSIWILKTTK